MFDFRFFDILSWIGENLKLDNMYLNFFEILYIGKIYNIYFEICFDNGIIFMNYFRDYNNIYCLNISFIIECNNFKLNKI